MYGAGAAWSRLEPPFFAWCRSRPNLVGAGSGTSDFQSRSRPKKWWLRNTGSETVLWIRSQIHIGSVLDPYSGASWFRIPIRIQNTDPDPHVQIKGKMEAEDVRFKYKFTIQRLNLLKTSLGDILFLQFSKNMLNLKENYVYLKNY